MNRVTTNPKRQTMHKLKANLMNEQRLIQLIREAQDGSREAFGTLIERFEPVVFAIVLRRLRAR